MSDADDDPRCPECGGPIGQTATYCMHCSADLTEDLEAADSDGDGRWDESDGVSAGSDSADIGADYTPPEIEDPATEVEPAETATSEIEDTAAATAEVAEAETATSEIEDEAAATGTVAETETGDADDQLLDPDGIVDNTMTVIVGIGAGIVVGFVGTIVFTAVTGSLWGIAFGFVAWVVSTAHLVRRRTVQGAISRGAYAVAIVLFLIPFVTLSPVVSAGGVAERLSGFVLLLVFMGVPAGIVAALGFVASLFVPDEGGDRG